MELVDKDKVYYCSPFVQAKNFTQLMLCVLNNDLENASSYISEINAKNSEEWTALHIACRNSKTFSSEEMVDFLLKNGADPNAKNNNDCTPLHWASFYSNTGSSLATVEALLRNGADPNAKACDNYTPLHLASRNSNELSSLATVELLLKNGADPNTTTKFGSYTSLHIVSMYLDNHLEVDKLLLQYNATPIDEQTQILKLKIDIESFVEANEKLKQRIEMLENED